MLRSVSRRFRWGVERYLPDAFVFTILLSFITLAMGILITRQTPAQMIEHWYGGFWDFLAFGMQMALILLTGYCLAMAPIVQRGLSVMARIPKSPRAAITMTIAVTALASWLSWGIGFVLGPIFAREIARRVRVDYPLLIAAAYCTTIATLPVGLTLTAPVLVNTPGHFMEAQIGLLPLSQTIFSPMLITTAALALFGVLWAFRNMIPADDEAFIVDEAHFARLEGPARVEPSPTNPSFAERLNDSRLITWILVAGGFFWMLGWFGSRGLDLNLNILNFSFLMIGLALHGSLRRYAAAFTAGARATGQVILQFPFYAGIMGMMAGSGLVVVIAEWMVSIANPYSFGFLAMLSSGLVNIFVPSAGGQWAIQGPILVEAARQLDVPVAVAVNAFSIGDLWTNLFQPFLALPALGIAGLGLRDIWGYCLVILVLFGFAGAVATLIVPLIFGPG
jgi:short-chain fatty acids transporter